MERLVYIRNYVDSLIEKITVSPNKDIISIKRNELTHSYGVSMLCQILACKRGLNIELAAIIGHLHDLGRILFNLLDDSHGKIGAEEAFKLLKNSKKFSVDEIEIICNAIRNHMYKSEIGSPYEEIIKDADILERYYWKPELYKNYGGERLHKALIEIGQ